MPEIDRNQIDSEGRGRSTNKGDVPDPLRRRYYLDDRGGPGLGFYADARIQTAAFRDLGARLVAPRSDPNAIRDMTTVAKHRGWTDVVVHGDPDFRREAWLAAMAIGIDVRGYLPTDRDRQELDRRKLAIERRASGRDTTKEPRDVREDAKGGANMRVVEAVVRSRIGDRPMQERVLTAARLRIAGWLERGARIEPLSVGERAQPAPPRERQRAR